MYKRLMTFWMRFNVPPTTAGWIKAVNKMIKRKAMAGLRATPLRSAAPAAIPRAQAYVDKGNWWAKCSCYGIEYVSPEVPLFFCMSCNNAAYGGRPLNVDFPQRWAEIDRLLMLRPDPLTRNYKPHQGDTFEHIIEDNIIHGIAGV